MLESYSRAWTEIDYDAIAHNVEEVRKLVKKTKIMGIVKANAYGLGDVACAKALQKCGVDYFGVSSVDEALNLRNALPAVSVHTTIAQFTKLYSSRSP